ncbi:HNH endonuclease signature motif containing protein, partial [Nocardioides sp. NPDC051685]|uniref:HNH endonuclease signature motif containing protein n=1 Tax=Nocardioides sp. NPDC051685 TaxID=3364334 RepID=UPI0037BB84A3
HRTISASHTEVFRSTRQPSRTRLGDFQIATATWCDAHHLDPWAAGGKTNLKDGALLCLHHHRLAHNPAYVHERLPDGTIRFARRP